VARFSKSLGDRDQHLRELLSNARTTASVLAGRTDEIVRLIEDSNALMARLRSESAALDAISGSVSAVARQLGGFIADNRATLKPALERLNGVLTLLDDRRDKLQEAIARLNPFLLSLGESISAGPFFKVYIANLLPGQFVQPFVEAAFSDLGLDPNILAPSQLNDPQTGQPATPALPVPFPRTGQGGEPRLTVPDAISGTPGNARYPYREPPAAPPPGGPPPGPPADVPVPPGPTPVFDPGTEMSPDPSRPTGDAQ
jgi:phospholipid/cholesterol/gamma-HCH transport system substrate-binding protein